VIVDIYSILERGLLKGEQKFWYFMGLDTFLAAAPTFSHPLFQEIALSIFTLPFETFRPTTVNTEHNFRNK
jgi:hypothetical protein